MSEAIDFANQQCDLLLSALWGYPPKPDKSSPPNMASYIMVRLTIANAIYRWGKIKSTSEGIFTDLENSFVDCVNVMQSIGVDCFRKWKNDIKERLLLEGFESLKKAPAQSILQNTKIVWYGFGSYQPVLDLRKSEAANAAALLFHRWMQQSNLDPMQIEADVEVTIGTAILWIEAVRSNPSYGSYAERLQIPGENIGMVINELYNLTGIDLSPKELEMLRKAMPELSRVLSIEVNSKTFDAALNALSIALMGVPWPSFQENGGVEYESYMTEMRRRAVLAGYKVD